MNAFTKKFIGCNIFAALFFLSACQDSNDSSIKQPDQIIESIAIEKTVDSTTDQDKKEKVKKPSKAAESDQNSNAIPTADVFFSVTAENPTKQESFNCDDQVFAVIKFANHQPKLHQINISWKDPNGTEREKNSFPFFVTEKETLAWASLKLHRSVGAGMLQWVNPAAGMEEFIGIWTVDVQVGDILKKTLNFEVLC